MRDLLDIQNFIFAAAPEEDLVLCTIVRKQGSSYRGLGAKKIISTTQSCGLLSGGCLEASIEKMARDRLLEMPFIESFSTLAEEDRLLGYQTGCQGVIDVLFERLPSRSEDHARMKIDQALLFGEDPTHRAVQIPLDGPWLGSRLPYPTKETVSERVFIEKWVQPVDLVIIGCGADAPAYHRLAEALGWSIRFVDYRRDLARAEAFPQARVSLVSLQNMASAIPQGPTTAVVLMTHNYEADLEIIRGLKNHKVGYLGCLGPAARFERLKRDLANFYGETLSQDLLNVISAPAGIFSHGRSPSEIALAVIAEIQEKLIEDKKTRAWTLILAAGESKRFGSAKALAPFRGQTLIERALETAKGFGGSRTLVVTGCYAEELTDFLQDTQYVYNERWQKGMGTSIAKGVSTIRNLDAHAEMIVVLPVDQPWVEISLLHQLKRLSKLTNKCALTAGHDFMGPPAVIPSRFFENAESLKHDQGLKSILRKQDIVAVEQPLAARDVDRPEELETLTP